MGPTRCAVGGPIVRCLAHESITLLLPSGFSQPEYELIGYSRRCSRQQTPHQYKRFGCFPQRSVAVGIALCDSRGFGFKSALLVVGEQNTGCLATGRCRSAHGYQAWLTGQTPSGSASFARCPVSPVNAVCGERVAGEHFDHKPPMDLTLVWSVPASPGS